MQIKMGKVYFIDSCLFIKAPLSSLPSQFGLEGVEKGDFPHEFNLKSNYNYVGQLPSPEFYGVHFTNKKKHEEFIKWWSEEDSAIRSGTKPLWNFKTEIVKYCMQDVDVLRKSWLAFEMVCKDAFYCDTDSVFFLELLEVLFSRQESRIPLSDFLGGMREEFSGCCDRFFALGPKNYGYHIEENGKTVVKVRGFHQ